MELPTEVLDLIFPAGTTDWFELTSGQRNNDDTCTHIVFSEKDIPPLPEADKNKKITGRKFHDITISDFPLRGRKTLLTFRRRYWKVEGQKKYLKRDIQLNFPGTLLEQEFAAFLKEDSQ